MREYAEFRISTVLSEEGSALIALEGELDLYTAPELKDALADLPDDVRSLVIDLTQVQFIDSAGLGVLVAAARKLRDGDGDVKLAGVDDNILKLFRVTGLDRYFAIETRA